MRKATTTIAFGSNYNVQSPQVLQKVIISKPPTTTTSSKGQYLIISSSRYHQNHHHHPIKSSSYSPGSLLLPNHQAQADDEEIDNNNNIVTPNRNSTTLMIRREAIGLGVGIVCSFFFLQQPQTAAAATTTTVLASTSSAAAAGNNISYCSDNKYTVTPSGLQFCDQVIGTGTQPATKGQLIKAHYVGKLENGKIFDSSYNRGKPLTFRVGVGEVIKGWDQGILGGDGIPPMLPGGKRSLKLPSQLGYGMRGAGCKRGTTDCIIPPDSTLLFDVEFIGKA